ncbi:MAG: hypothetical protein JWP89_4779 [Schlesneria sp.]|nr:hypothetical protein [Schlesneria sp.]
MLIGNPLLIAGKLPWTSGCSMESQSIRRLTNVACVFIGVCYILAALLGLLYNAISMTAVVLDSSAQVPFMKHDDYPFFYHAFFTMSGICVACYLVLFVCGIDLVRFRLRSTGLVTLVMVFEVIYFFSICTWWRDPTVGLSVAAATGIANGGLVVQFLVLLPLWGPIILWWAKIAQRHSQVA